MFDVAWMADACLFAYTQQNTSSTLPPSSMHSNAARRWSCYARLVCAAQAVEIILALNMAAASLQTRLGRGRSCVESSSVMPVVTLLTIFTSMHPPPGQGSSCVRSSPRSSRPAAPLASRRRTCCSSSSTPGAGAGRNCRFLCCGAQSLQVTNARCGGGARFVAASVAEHSYCSSLSTPGREKDGQSDAFAQCIVCVLPGINCMAGAPWNLPR